VGGQRQAPAALPPEKTRYPLFRRLGGPQSRSGQVRKISPPLGFNPRNVQPVASRYTDCDILDPSERLYMTLILSHRVSTNVLFVFLKCYYVICKAEMCSLLRTVCLAHLNMETCSVPDRTISSSAHVRVKTLFTSLQIALSLNYGSNMIHRRSENITRHTSPQE